MPPSGGIALEEKEDMTMKKMTKVLTIAAFMSSALLIQAYAGEWKQDEKGYWYIMDSNAYARSQAYEINGVTYGFDDSAYMVTGWKQFDSKWYYFDPATGGALTGWQMLDGVWYYLEPAMHTGWLDLGGKRYYMNPSSGAMQTDWFEVAGSSYRYRAHPDGSLYRNEENEEDGITFAYQEDGTIKYKTANTAKTGQSWQDLLVGSAQAMNVADQKSALEEKLDEIKEKRVELYYSKVYPSRWKNTYTRKYNSWKSTTISKLQAAGASAEDISKFIASVLRGDYKDSYASADEYEYEYEYEYEECDE